MTALTAVAVIFLSFSVNSFAATGIVRPEATDVVTNWHTTEANHYSAVNEAVTQPTAPGTSAYIYTGTDLGTNVADEFNMGTLSSVDSVSNITVWMYAWTQTQGGGQYDDVEMNIYIGGTYQTLSTKTMTASGTWYWASFDGSWSQADLDGLQVRLNRVYQGTGRPRTRDDDVRVTAVYAVITYTLPPDYDGTLTAGASTEPATLSSIADSDGEKVRVFDFTITDGGTADLSSLDVTKIALATTGSTGEINDLTWKLYGDVQDAGNAWETGTVLGSTIEFDSLNISVGDGQSETYEVWAFFSTSPGGTTEGDTFKLTVNNAALTVSAGGTQLAGSQSVDNDPGFEMDVEHTQLIFSTQPPAAAEVDADFSGTIVVSAVDVNGNVDVDFDENITLSAVITVTHTAPNGTLSSTDGLTQSTSGTGTATWTDTKYSYLETIDLKAVSATTYTSAIYSEPVLMCEGEGNYSYRRSIVINHEKVGLENNGTLPATGFPVLVSLSGDWLKNSDYAGGRIENSQGWDIVFRKSDGVTPLYFEREAYDGTNGTLMAWVRIDSLSQEVDTTFYVYYGNACQTSDPADPANVWDNHFVGVYHLAEDVDNEQSGGTHDDSSGTNDGTQYGNAEIAGKIADGQDFDGDNDYVSIGNVIGTADAVTVSAWVKFDNLTTTVERSVSLGDQVVLRHDGTQANGAGQFHFYIRTDDTVRSLRLDKALTTGAWHYVAGTWDGTTQSAYLEGLEKDSQIPGGTLTEPTNGTISSASAPMDGVIDEVRISTTARDADWIITEYNNQSDTTIDSGYFIKSLGGEEAVYFSLGDHAVGQHINALMGSSPFSGAQLFGFQLTNNSTGTVTVDTVAFQLSAVSGIEDGNFTESQLKIYEDTNGDGTISGESTTVGGTPVVDVGTGTIIFSSDFTLSAGTTVNYVLKGDVNSLVSGDTFTIDLAPGNVALTSGSTGGSAATSVTHTYCGSFSYAYRRSITIDYTKVGADNSGTLPATGFPVLVSLTGDWLKTTTADPTNGRIENANGWDIIFREDDGETPLYHEIEAYDGSASGGTLVAWVRIDSLSKAADTSIYIYYGNPCMAHATEDPDNVWDSSFKGVWHLAEQVTKDTSGGIHENSCGTDDGIQNNNGSIAGKIAGAQDFDGNGDYIQVANFSRHFTDRMTLSGWVQTTSLTPANFEGYFGIRGAASSSHYFYILQLTGSANLETRFWNSLGNGWSAGGAIPEVDWVHLALTYDGDDLIAYVNGAVDGQNANATGYFSASNFPFQIGCDGNTGNFMDGVVDEVRFSNTPRDLDWIRTEYNNQFWPNTAFADPDPTNPNNPGGGFLTVSGTEETGFATAVDLVTFAAAGEGSAVKVSWETAGEIDNKGFHLYRSNRYEGPFERLTDKLIPGAGIMTQTRTYSFMDADVTRGKLYYYQLEDIDIRGQKTLHGPVCVDWDGDGIPDDWERAFGLNPGVDDAGLDPDNDGLSNYQEYLHGSDPRDADSDGDGIVDGQEAWRLEGLEADGSRMLGRGVDVLSEDADGLVLELRTPGFEAESVAAPDGREFARLRIDNYIHGYTNETGRPQLPVKGILLDVPPGKAARIRVLDTDVEHHGGYLVYPVPEQSDADQRETDGPAEVFEIDEAFYLQDGAYPAITAGTGRRYVFRGQAKHQILFYPLAFNPAFGELTFYSRIRLRVDYVDAALLQDDGPQPVAWQAPTAEPDLTADGMLASLNQAALLTPGLTAPLTPVLSSARMLLGALWSPFSEEASSGQTAYKILTSAEGIFRLTAADFAAPGIDVAALDLSRIRLYYQGTEAALYIYDADGDNKLDAADYILFYGRAPEEAYAKYTKSAVYWLTLDGGEGTPKRMAAVTGTPAGGQLASEFEAVVHHEVDNLYGRTAPGPDSLERWFFADYIPGDGWDPAWVPNAGDLIPFTVALPGAVGTGTLTIELFATFDQDHELTVAVNGTGYGTFTWSGVDCKRITLENVPLLDGNNTVSLACSSGEDTVLLDWIEVDYARNFAAGDNQLKFSHPAGYRYTVSDLSGSDLMVFDISDAADVGLVTGAVTSGSGSYSLEFEPQTHTEKTQTFLVLSDLALKTPDSIRADAAGNLGDNANGADYILITHRELGWDGGGGAYPWLDDLISLRRAQGLRVKVVDVADIYDEFSYGHITPQALRDFLAYAYGHWTPPAPRYVFLVGDHTYDYKNISGGAVENFVPTWLTFTDFMGETATDEYFTRISGDDAVPDLYIGRLPAKSAAEAAVMVQKIIDYEQAANTKTWQKDTLLVADDQTEDYERVFELINEDAAGMLPVGMNSPTKAYLRQYVVARDLTADIKRGFDPGSLIINYSGHGGFNLWANERIFDVSNAWPGYYHDVDDLAALTEDQKGRYPFVVSMSCLSGYFAGLGTWENPSLMEALLRAADKGAAAALMPTGETTTEGQHILNSALFEALFTEDIRRLGPAVAAAKQTLLANGGSYYDQVSATFLLFGDPAMELKVPLPRRPTGLSAQLTAAAAVALAWNPALDANGQPAAGYHLYRSTTPSSGNIRLTGAPLAGTAYTDASVSSGPTYYYTVTAVDNDGDESVPSASVSVALIDSDSDGLPDVLEAAGCTGLATADSDGDGLPDGIEDANLNGTVDAGETDPCTADSDGDGLPDGWEASHGLDALNADGSAGADGDADGDGWTNTQEYLSCTDPADSASMPSAPTAPAVNYPADAAEVATLRPQLSVNNAADADCQDLRYVFEVYADQQLTDLVAATDATGIAEAANTTAWQAPIQLSDNTAYYWRARAYDGLGYSNWMATAEFFVNTAPEAPSIPAVSAPPDGSEVTVLQPTLQIVNAADADRDTVLYDFRVFADETLSTLVSAKNGVMQGAGNTTAWQVPDELSDNTHYWWTAQATDEDGLIGGWSSPAGFFVNTANDAPTAPPGGSPADGAEVSTTTPLLAVAHAVDADLDALSYYFEIDTAGTFDSFELEQSVPLAEQAGATTTWAPLELLDNTTYHWRVRAYDGAAYGPWYTGSFFVNTENDAPEAPAVDRPGDQSEVAVQQPILAVKAAVDADGDALTYDFELYADSDLTQSVSEAAGTGLSWPVDVTLKDNYSYFWRARAVDAHAAAGPWSQTAAFFVNTANDAPAAPVLNNPVSGGTDTSLTPTLSVFNAEDPDQDALSYEFELYADPDLTQLVSAAVVEQGYLFTSWTVPAALADHSSYYWRVRADDGRLTGSWMPTAVLTVNTAGADTYYQIASRQEISARSRDRQIVAVTAADSPIFNTSVEIPPGALRDNCTINIGAVTNPPALRARTRAVGRVIEFGPSGMIFSVPVTIKLPYTAAALKQARVADTSELQVFYYDTALLAWVPVDIDSIDVLNQLVSIKADHFSMYTIGAAVADDPSAGGGSGVSCFVSSAQAGLLGTELSASTILGLLALIGLLWLGNKRVKGKRPKVKRSAYGIRYTAGGVRHTVQGTRPTAQGASIKERREPDDKPGTPQLL